MKELIPSPAMFLFPYLGNFPLAKFLALASSIFSCDGDTVVIYDISFPTTAGALTIVLSNGLSILENLLAIFSFPPNLLYIEVTMLGLDCL